MYKIKIFVYIITLFISVFVLSCSLNSNFPSSGSGSGSDNKELWINAVYNKGWKTLLDEDFSFAPNGNFVMDFKPTPFSPNSFTPQVDTAFILDEVITNGDDAYYSLTYILNGKDIELYVLIGYGKTKSSMLLYLPEGHASPPSSSSTSEQKELWLTEKYSKGYLPSSLGTTIAVKN